MRRILSFVIAVVLLCPLVQAEPLELPPQVDRVIPYQQTQPDRIRDHWENPRTVYQQMRSGEYDREPMTEVKAVDFEENQLPEPTLIESAPPSATPVNSIPAQRIVHAPLGAEERVYQLISKQSQDAEELQQRLQEARETYDVAPEASLRRVTERLRSSDAVRSAP